MDAPSVLLPCETSPHRGLGIGSEALRTALTTADAWVARLVCRAFRDRCPHRPGEMWSVVTSPERCRLAQTLGLDGGRICTWAAQRGDLYLLQWARSCGCAFGPWSFLYSAEVRAYMEANGEVAPLCGDYHDLARAGLDGLCNSLDSLFGKPSTRPVSAGIVTDGSVAVLVCMGMLCALGMQR